MIRRNACPNILTLASLVTMALLAPNPVRAEGAPKSQWSQSNLRNYQQDREAQRRSMQQYQMYQQRAKNQLDKFNKHGNPKQLLWSRQNKSRAAQAKVQAMEAKIRRLNALASRASQAGNTSRAQKLRLEANKVSRQAKRYVGAIARYNTKHGLNRTSSLARPKQPMTTTVQMSSPLTKNQGSQLGKEYNRHSKSHDVYRIMADTAKRLVYSGKAGIDALRSAIAYRALAARSQVRMWRAEARTLRAKGQVDVANRLEARAVRRGRAIKAYVAKYQRYLPREVRGEVAGQGAGMNLSRAQAAMEKAAKSYQENRSYADANKQLAQSGSFDQAETNAITRSAMAGRIRSHRAAVRYLKAQATALRDQGYTEDAKYLEARADRKSRAIKRYLAKYGKLFPKQEIGAGGRMLPERLEQEVANYHNYRGRADDAKHFASTEEAKQYAPNAVLRSAVANRIKAHRSELRFLKAQASELRAQGLSKEAAAVEARVNRKSRAIKKYLAKYKKFLPKLQEGQIVANPSTLSGGKIAPIKPMDAKQGRKVAKAQIDSGNFWGALETLKRMEAAPRKGGIIGWFTQRRHVNKTRKRVLAAAVTAGKQGAGSGDFSLAQEALAAIEELGRMHPEINTSKQFGKVADSALDGAKRMYKGHQSEMAFQLTELAKEIQTGLMKIEPSRRYRRIRKSAASRVWDDLERRAKDGNMEGFRSALRLAVAYTKENGQLWSKKQVGKVRELKLMAQKRSVIRALDDAETLTTMYGNPSEAAQRLEYAQDTANTLAKRGITIRTGLFRRGIAKRLQKTREMIVQAFQKQGSPAPMKYQPKWWERWLIQPHNFQQQPQVMPLDSKWLRSKELQQLRQIAQENNMTVSQVRQALQAQQGGGVYANEAMGEPMPEAQRPEAGLSRGDEDVRQKMGMKP